MELEGNTGGTSGGCLRKGKIACSGDEAKKRGKSLLPKRWGKRSGTDGINRGMGKGTFLEIWGRQ